MIGKWIEGLSAEEKDRIIEGQKWCTKTMSDINGAHCITGHVSQAEYCVANPYWINPLTGNCTLPTKTVRHGYYTLVRGIGDTFDRLVHRFGMDRIVRACKMRAGKPQPKIYKPVHQPSLDRVAIGSYIS